MMKKAKLIIEDESGNILSEHSYNLGKGLNDLSSIEQSVLSVRKELLSDMSQDLLLSAQQEDEKKEN